jgi:hypothetical protein
VVLCALILPASAALAQNIGDVAVSTTGEHFVVIRGAGGRPTWAPIEANDPAVARATRVIVVERYSPGIWVDPDGCQHWVMDDGFEGYMSPHLRRDGTPVCNR